MKIIDISYGELGALTNIFCDIEEIKVKTDNIKTVEFIRDNVSAVWDKEKDKVRVTFTDENATDAEMDY